MSPEYMRKLPVNFAEGGEVGAPVAAPRTATIAGPSGIPAFPPVNEGGSVGTSFDKSSSDDFGDGDSDDDDDDDGGGDDGGKKRKKAMWIPEDHKQVFRGNTDDHFRLGVKVTKASVRMYVDFFGSDVLVASPLGAFAKFLSLSSHFIFFSLHLDGADEDDGGGGGGGGDDRESR